MALRRTVGGCAALGLLAACSGDSHAPEADARDEPSARPVGQFGGALEGTEALVGIVSGEDRLLVYACDGDTISHWFVADGTASELALYGIGGALLEIAVDEDEARGTITLPDASEHNFEARPQTDAVLHRALADVDEGRLLAGWVTVDGETRGNLELRPNVATLSTTRLVGPAPALPRTLNDGSPTPITISQLAKVDSLQNVSLTLPLVAVSVQPRAPTPNRPGTFVVAGVGDSYASGEGGPVEIADDEVNEPDNYDEIWGSEWGMAGCHRSDDAGIPRAFRKLRTTYPGIPMELIFVACGGSKIAHVIDDVRGDAATSALQSCNPLGGPVPGGERTDRWRAIDEPPQLDQVIDAVQALDSDLGAKPPVDVLAMSIGGNDAGFAPTVAQCITGGLYDALVQNLHLDGVDVDIDALNLLGPPCHEDPDLVQAFDEGPDSNNKYRHVIPGFAVVAGRYADLDQRIDEIASDPARSNNVAIGQVLITHYGAGLRGSSDPDDYCGAGDEAVKKDVFGLIDKDEARFLEHSLVRGINGQVDAAVAAANGTGGPRWKAVSSHVAVFEAHGPCAAEPFTHINNTALARQGNNLPDVPEDCTRTQLRVLNDAVATGVGAGIACSGGPATCFLLGGTGATIGLIVGLATMEQNSAISAGLAHPNPKGWQAVGDALYPEFEAALRRAFMPARPDRLRQYGAVLGGRIVMRWDDLASTETRYELEISDLEMNRLSTIELGADVTDYTYEPGKSFVGFFRVRACNDAFCSRYTEYEKATNRKAGVPTGVEAEIRETGGLRVVGSMHALPRAFLTVFGIDANRADTFTKIELTLTEDSSGPVANPVPQVFTTNDPFASMFAIGGATGIRDGVYSVRAASCNVLGCSGFAASVQSTRRGPGGPQITLPEELPPSFMDRFGRVIPTGDVVPRGPGPDPDPDPSQP